MYFQDLASVSRRLSERLARERDISVESTRTVAAPYRIAPLGAHIDHQGGPVLGMTIGAFTTMAYVPSDDGTVDLISNNYPGRVRFSLQNIPQAASDSWGGYARAAGLALGDEYRLHTGLHGIVDGMLPGAGLSSSASVLLAYLYALSDVNGVTPGEWDYVRLTSIAENRHIGLRNGILDQTSIVFGHQNKLLYINTKEREVEQLSTSADDRAYRVLVAFSGYSRELKTTGYNTRVEECGEAASRLAALAGLPSAEKLSDVPREAFSSFKHRLPGPLARRAEHYYGEVARVLQGVSAWKAGDLVEFGRLMLESCQSSIQQYESGSPAIHDLQGIVASAEGVVGARFNGGGFGGCVVGFFRSDLAVAAAGKILDAYRDRHPEVADRAAVYLTESAEGVKRI